uniref:Uncharacterized protein n=1 Tax=Meloidogyne hapla TaxID=6305 RepID=A0A1I8BXE8_MELHA
MMLSIFVFNFSLQIVKIQNLFCFIFILLIGNGAFCKDIHYINKSLRLQVKNFLKENLPKCRNVQTNEALFHLFQGLSFFNDHYRFGGIFDYCIEKELIKSTINVSNIFGIIENQELLINAKKYVECAEAIYSTYIHMDKDERQNNDGIL